MGTTENTEHRETKGSSAPSAVDDFVRAAITAAAANHGDGEVGSATFREATFPVIRTAQVDIGRRLQELGVGYEIAAWNGQRYVSVRNDRRALDALKRMGAR